MPDMYPVLVGVGHCCQDTICTVEAYPPEDGSTHITDMDSSQGGGAVATALVAACKLGVSTAMLANLGDDPAGDQILAEFEHYGVDVRGIERIAGGRSSTSYVMVNPQRGTRTKFPYRDNLPPLALDTGRQQLLRHAQVLHLDGTQYDNALAAATLAKRYGVTVSLDGCSVQADNRQNLQLASMADILIVNAKYPFRVTGRDSLTDAMRDLAALGEKKAVIATFGSDGCYAWLDGGLAHFTAAAVQAVDTTGAGDVFHGAYLAAYLQGKDTRACIRFAAATAALKCLHVGGRKGIPTYAQAEAFAQSL